MQFTFIAILIFSTFIYYSCEDSGTELDKGSEGSLVIKITDGPFPIEQVAGANVTINKIEIRKTDENDGNPFIIVSEDTTTCNLINLRNGITEDLPKIEIPVGTYNLVRLCMSQRLQSY